MESSIRYNIKPRKSPQWKQHSYCRIGVSIGNLAFEKDKLNALLSWVQHRYSRCFLYIADTVQRHNYIWEVGMSEKDAYEKALEDGNEWLLRNESILNQYTSLQDIDRWDKWRNSESFQFLHQAVTAVCNCNDLAQIALHTDIQGFLKRRTIDPLCYEFACQKCRDFLIEEIVVHTLMARDVGAAKFYPSKQLEIMRVFRERLIEDAPAGLENDDYIRFTFLRK